MKLERKIQLLVLGLALTPILVSSLVFASVITLSRESERFQEVHDFRRWIKREVLDPLKRGVRPADLEIDRRGFVAVSDNRGRVLTASHPQIAPFGRRPPPAPRLAEQLDTHNVPHGIQIITEVITSDLGEEYRVTYAQPMLEDVIPFDLVRSLSVAVVFACMVIGGGLAGTRIVRDFQKRLRFVRTTTGKLASGDLSQPIEIPPQNDEVHLLAHDLEAMRISLQETNNQRSRLLMGVSHDLGTPLTTILGYVEALEDDLFRSREERSNALHAIRHKGELLRSRIQQLVEYARLETGEWRKRMEWITVREYLMELSEIVLSDMEVSGRTFTYHVEVPSTTCVIADHSLLDRAFENLVQNALRYTRPGDEVRLHATVGDGVVTVRIEDNGPGFGALTPEELFEPFRRASRDRNQAGFGLGLSVTRSILATMGMTIIAEHSSLGGAAFVITLPVA